MLSDSHFLFPVALGDVVTTSLTREARTAGLALLAFTRVGERACCMPEPVNTSSSGSKLNEFYEMQRMLIVFVIQSAAFDCPGYEAPVAGISTLLTFDPPRDLQSLMKSTPPRNWITKVGFKFFAELHQGANP